MNTEKKNITTPSTVTLKESKSVLKMKTLMPFYSQIGPQYICNWVRIYSVLSDSVLSLNNK